MDVSNGVLSFSDNHGYHDFGSSVTYVCSRGYELSDTKNAIRICLPKAKWSGTAPQCRGKCYTAVKVQFVT